MNASNDILRLNVGFIIHETVGYSRDFPIEIDSIRIPPDLALNNLNGWVRVTRTAQGLLVQVKMTAEMPSECARCLEEFSLPLTVNYADLYAFNLNSVTESGLLVPETGKINLAPILREEMLLSVPISPTCKPNCKGLCPICGENLNLSPCNHEEQDIDPRLAGLRSLLD
jgi:uncharacterized protein